MADKARFIIKTERIIMLPATPNFIRTERDECIPIEDMTEEQLRDIGKQWVDALVQKAFERRRDKTKAINLKLRGLT